MWTREKIVELLQTRDDAVERGILRIYQLQTEDEKRSGSTKHSNGVGFNGADASYGTYLAQWLSKGKRLTGKHLERARRLTIKYSGQLTDIANQGRNAA